MFHTEIGQDIHKAKALLLEDSVVAIPTETVYGLAANALSEEAVVKIFAAKNRPFFDPLIVHTYSLDAMRKYVEDIPAKAIILLQQFSPGPITLLLKKKIIIPDLVTSGLDTVAMRIPNHPLTLSLLRELEFPLAAPSANPFGYISPTTAQHVADQLQGKIPYILDGGVATVGVESTIVGFEGEQPVVFRLGGLTIEKIERVIGKVQIRIQDSSNPAAPGMLSSHYAPIKKLRLVGEESHELEKLDKRRMGVIAFDKYIETISKENQILLSPKGDLSEAAKNLFAAMRRLDNSNVDLILAVHFPDIGLGRAINDRLKRASTT
ncbi:MAG: threonylcarbamoyl-AMP synthase [Bacteroidetes bacterium]|nr:threonylcarbamoyl-AMP synthase [Bacteroidota bacterium]